MSTPANNTADTQANTDYFSDDAKSDANKSNELSFADRVNDAVSKMTKDSDGNWQLPDDIKDDAVKHAALTEKRYRDTQSAYTKTQQQKKALEAENSVLKDKASSNVQVKLTDEQKEELEELKFSDPDKWRSKMNTYEANAREEYKKELEEDVKKVSTSTLEKEELDRREAVLAEFKSKHTDFDIDDDIIANDIPPRITKKLENGDITFEEFLQECYDYSKTGKVVKQTEDKAKDVNLSKIGGGDKPDANAEKEDIITSYSKEVY